MKKITLYLIVAAMFVGSFILVQYIKYEASETGYPVSYFAKKYFGMYNHGRSMRDSIIAIPDECYEDSAFFIAADRNHDRGVTLEELRFELTKADLDDDGIISDAEASKLRGQYGLSDFGER